jgi:uncharacterized membrane protein YphA (DoxX/SURF4 family)
LSRRFCEDISIFSEISGLELGKSVSNKFYNRDSSNLGTFDMTYARALSLLSKSKTKMMKKRLVGTAVLLLRVALAAAFLSAVADRLGLWGPAGTEGVGWGDLAHFNAYVAKLNWFLPASIIPWVGWAATLAESLLAVGLLVGWQLRWIALASATLLLLFAITMLIALGPKAPLDYSVFTSTSAAFLLFVMHSEPKRASPGDAATAVRDDASF